MARSIHSRSRGVALLIVVTILVTMVIVAVPFALSMRQGQQRTEAARARGRAVFEADILCEMAKLFLVRTTPSEEDERFFRGDRSVDAMSTVDSLTEITPTDRFRKQLEAEILSDWEKNPQLAAKAKYLASRGLGPLNDDRGSIWTVLIEDAQARVNVNGASPFLLGNLLGAALLTEDIDTGASDISVQNVTTGQNGGLRGFPRDGGYIRIGREVIAYETFDGDTFHSCQRGVLLETPLRDNGPAEAHDQGTPVIDYTAYKLATHLISRRPGQLTPFQNLESLRDIASWGEHGVITASRLERVLRYLTVWSRRETSSGYLAEQLVVNELPEAVDGSAAEQIRVRDRVNPSGTPANYNPGTIVRISDGVSTVYQTVFRVGDDDGRQKDSAFTTAGRVNAIDEDVTFTGGSTRVAARAPFPININTASVEVLYAVMANLQFWWSEGPEQIVSPELAWQLANELVEARKGDIQAEAESDKRLGGPFRNAEDFGLFLDAKVRESELTRVQFAALYTNAINPHSYKLRFGTAPWCYRTLDVYHLESRVALNNRAGEQIAEAAVREVVEIGSDRTSSWVVDSQADFEVGLAMGSGAKWVTSYPFAVTYKSNATHHIQPALRGEKAYLKGAYPSTARGEDPGDVDLPGDVRLEPARLLLAGEEVRDHFDFSWYADGHFTGFDGAYRRKTKDLFMVKGDTFIRPFTMSFWWRPYSDQNWTVFDAGMEQFQNRIGVFVQDGEEGPELTFRCCAANLWRQGAEVYVPLEQLDYEPGNWYHIHVSCDGEDPASMQMLVDGVDIGHRRGVTFLSGSITNESDVIPVESTAGFPVRGALRIGNEVVEYEGLGGSSFADCIRGARGTGPDRLIGAGYEFPTGTPVHVLGYSMPILLDVMEGGAHLAEELGTWNALRIKTFDTSHPARDQLPVPYGDSSTVFGGFHPGQGDDMVFETVGIWGYTWDEAAPAFGTKGLALVGCMRLSGIDDVDGVKVAGWEIVSYERADNVFTCTRFHEVPHQDPEEYFLITEWTQERIDWRAYIVPISVEATGAVNAGQDYLDPSDEVDQQVLARYGGDGTARVFLGTDDPEGAFEVIKYSYIERESAQPSILFVQEDNLAAVAAGFFGQGADEMPPPPTGGLPGTTPGPVPPGDDDPPVPTPDPPGGGFDDPPSDEPQDPTPGDGVPPGARDPSDPPDVPDPVDPGDPGNEGEVPGDGGGEPGTDDPTPNPGGGNDDGSSETDDGEPLDLDDEDDPEGDDGAEPEQAEEEGRSGDGEGDRDEPGDGGTAEAQPPEEEPSEDESGGGGDYGSDTDEKDDTKIPDVPPPAAEEEDEGEEEIEDDRYDPGGSINIGSGDRDGEMYRREYAIEHLRFRGVNRGYNKLADGGVAHTSPGSADSENALYLPCFRVKENWGPARIGRNDVITITDAVEGESTRVEVGVRWGAEDGDPDGSDWVALTEFPEHRFRAPEDGARTWRNDPRGRPRVMKFPCGELPDQMSTDLEFGQSQISGSELVSTFLDELHVWRYGADCRVRVGNPEGLLPDGEELRLVRVAGTQELTSLDGYDETCGVFLLEGELIVYRGSYTDGDNALVLERCARGQFGTRPTSHPIGAMGRFITDVPVSYLESGMTAESSTVPMARTKGWPLEGLVRIVREDTAELVHYTRLGEGELIMPTSLDADESTRDRGLFRGRFGTDATDHDSNEIVVFQPFRYWDRFAPRRSEEEDSFSGVHDHPDASYMELGTKARSAYWRGFSWGENLRGLSGATDTDGQQAGDTVGHLDIYVLARFSPNVPWDTTRVMDMREETAFGRNRNMRTLARDHLFLFDDQGDQPIGQSLHGNRLGLESDTAEYRIYFVYKANAYEPVDGARRESGGIGGDLPVLENTWKNTPWLRKFTVTYFSRTATRYRAPLR